MRRARRGQIDAVRKARMEAFDALPAGVRDLINDAPQVPDARDVQALLRRHGEDWTCRMLRAQFRSRYGVVRGP